MTREQYLQTKKRREEALKKGRPYCQRCRKPLVTCYCTSVQPFYSKPLFVILIHRAEVRRSVATGRMAHLCLSHSLLFEGTDFSHHEGVNQLIENPANHCVVLTPGPLSVNLTELSPSERTSLFPETKQPVIFVIDGTWAQARRMKRLSTNLHGLKSICFTPTAPSKFYVRRQPEAHYFSTIEAIHTLIDLCDWGKGNEHHTLMTAFSHMVGQQIRYEWEKGIPRGFRAGRGQR